VESKFFGGIRGRAVRGDLWVDDGDSIGHGWENFYGVTEYCIKEGNLGQRRKSGQRKSGKCGRSERRGLL
jgi:uncharacterized protein YmfQ (DUF2313 family)